MKKWALGALVAMSATSFGQLVVVTPFAGQLSEGFESFTPGTGVSQLSIIGGTTQMFSDPVAQHNLHPFSQFNWGLGSGVTAAVHGGTKALGIQNTSDEAHQDVDIVFSSDQRSFGGWFSMSVDGGSAAFRFFDAAGSQIGTDQSLVNHFSGAPAWTGFTSTVGFRRVHIVSNEAYVAMDDLQASNFVVVPEPSSIAAVGLGFACLLRRRKK